jgi:parallel beta-helix repeat protein
MTPARLLGCALAVLAVGLVAVPDPVGTMTGTPDQRSVTAAPVRPPEPTPGGARAPESSPPRRMVRPMSPHQFAVITKPELLRGSTRRTIVLDLDRVTLWTADRPMWTGYLPARPRGASRSLADIADVVARSPRPRWLVRVRPDVYQLNVALTQAPGTSLTVAGPHVRELRLLSGAQVYVSGVSARARFDRTRVLSWRADGRGPDTTPNRRRPFIAYKKAGSVLDLRRSQFSYLGGDVGNGYGVSWAPGSTGSAIECTFDHSFFGAYTSRADGVVFRRNVFRDNDVYGLDPHTGSTRLVIEDNEAYGNASHGIIISKDVVHSRLLRNRSHHNRGNGIMVDYSDDNVVAENRSWGNGRDGIVLYHSARVVVRGNQVTGNRVGVRVTSRSPGAMIEGNRITGNRIGLEIYNITRTGGRSSRPILVTNNEIDGDGNYDGVVLQDAVGVRAVGNTVSGHRDGVRFRYGIRVAGLSRDVVLNGNQVAYQQRGIQVGDGSSDVTLRGNTVRDASEFGIALAGPRISSTGDRVVASRDGMMVRGRVDVRDVSISDIHRGIVVAEGPAVIVGAHVRARDTGLLVAAGSELDLRASQIRGRPAVDGVDLRHRVDIRLTTVGPTVPLLGLAGAAFLVIAVLLYLVQRVRSRGWPEPVPPPPGLRNTA